MLKKKDLKNGCRLYFPTEALANYLLKNSSLKPLDYIIA